MTAESLYEDNDLDRDNIDTDNDDIDEAVNEIHLQEIVENKYSSVSSYVEGFESFIEYLYNIDHFIILFILGVCSGGLFGINISCGSFVIGLSMLLDKSFTDNINSHFTILCVYLIYSSAILFGYISLSTIGFSELGYSTYKSICRKTISSRCAAMIAISINLIWSDSFINWFLIMSNVIIRYLQSLECYIPMQEQ
tara:strand:- start:2830 stop:3417 length:588 start_codon:yes stop_codon:yes gene_type:complete